MKLNLFNSSLKKDFSIIEKELELAIYSEVPILNKASVQLLKAGGKRIRPIFVLLAAKYGNYNIHQIKHIAVALELIHMASLVHDDVIDHAQIRRGKPTINYLWNDRIAMYSGDFILARALDYMTKVENPLVHQILSRAIIEVCKGEIEQLRDKYDFGQGLRNYLRRINRKTAILIAVSCELGAVTAGTDQKTYRSLYRFGHFIGMAYQITDDILDFVGSEKQLGKPAGEDLRQGNITLPALYAMRDSSLKSEIMSVNENTSKEEMSNIIQKINNSGAIEYSQQFSRRYLDKARDILEELPDEKIKESLVEITNYIGKRKF